MTDHMENKLDMPLSEVLKIIQNRLKTKSTYFGVRAFKSPTDFWVYQEILYEVKPDVIIEIGNKCGGSTLALAHMCDLMMKGKVIGLDISHKGVPGKIKSHPRITFIESDACDSFTKVKKLVSPEKSVLIIEDSSHTYRNTLNVLMCYESLIKPGGYFIVEDGICHHGLVVGPAPGPYEAIEKFISMNDKFEIDRDRESFLITWNPKGYLRRKE